MHDRNSRCPYRYGCHGHRMRPAALCRRRGVSLRSLHPRSARANRTCSWRACYRARSERIPYPRFFSGRAQKCACSCASRARLCASSSPRPASGNRPRRPRRAEKRGAETVRRRCDRKRTLAREVRERGGRHASRCAAEPSSAVAIDWIYGTARQASVPGRRERAAKCPVGRAAGEEASPACAVTDRRSRTRATGGVRRGSNRLPILHGPAHMPPTVHDPEVSI